MKKFFTVVGIFFSVLIVIGIIGFFILNHFGSKLDSQSKAYVDEVVPKIISNWDVQTLISESSSELLKVAPRDKIESMFKAFSDKLGRLKDYKNSKGQAGINVTPQGKFTTGAYVAEASFEKGDATVWVRTILTDEKWQIIEFRVNSEALMP